jgi:hypothetical protein
LIIDSRITEVVLDIHLLYITVITVVWEVFIRFVSFELACMIVSEETWNWIPWIKFIFYIKNLLVLIEKYIFGLRDPRLLCLFNFIIILYQSILIIQFCVFVLTIFFSHNLIRILNYLIVAFNFICVIFTKFSYIDKTLIGLLLTLL